MVQKLLLLLAGGMCGTVGRFAVSNTVQRWMGAEFPYGTLTVNLLGCMAGGFLGVLLEQRSWLTPEARVFYFSGLLGAFTTFSALIYESWRLIQNGNQVLAALNLLGSLALGLAAMWLGALAASLL